MTPAFFGLLFISAKYRVYPGISARPPKVPFEAQPVTATVAGYLTNYLMLL
jgi:hypothetical protein